MSNALAPRALGVEASNVALGWLEAPIFHARLLRAVGVGIGARALRRHMIARRSSSATLAQLCSVLGVALGALERSVARVQKEGIISLAPRPPVGGVLGSARMYPSCGIASHRRCLHRTCARCAKCDQPKYGVKTKDLAPMRHCAMCLMATDRFWWSRAKFLRVVSMGLTGPDLQCMFEALDHDAVVIPFWDTHF